MNVERQFHTRNGPHTDRIRLMLQECQQLGSATKVSQLNILKRSRPHPFVPIRKGVSPTRNTQSRSFLFQIDSAHQKSNHPPHATQTTVIASLLQCSTHRYTICIFYREKTSHCLHYIYSNFQKGAAICQQSPCFPVLLPTKQKS